MRLAGSRAAAVGRTRPAPRCRPRAGPGRRRRPPAGGASPAGRLPFFAPAEQRLKRAARRCSAPAPSPGPRSSSTRPRRPRRRRVRAPPARTGRRAPQVVVVRQPDAEPRRLAHRLLRAGQDRRTSSPAALSPSAIAPPMRPKPTITTRGRVSGPPPSPGRAVRRACSSALRFPRGVIVRPAVRLRARTASCARGDLDAHPVALLEVAGQDALRQRRLPPAAAPSAASAARPARDRTRRTAAGASTTSSLATYSMPFSVRSRLLLSVSSSVAIFATSISCSGRKAQRSSMRFHSSGGSDLRAPSRRPPCSPASAAPPRRRSPSRGPWR